MLKKSQDFPSATTYAALPLVREQMQTTLKKDCPTRWNCVLAMLESLVNKPAASRKMSDTASFV